MTETVYTVTCAACGTGNRIKAEMEGKRGRCGSCHTPLPPLYCHPLTLGETSFDGFVNSYTGPVLAEFWAPW